jgi:hypothetical protein
VQYSYPEWSLFENQLACHVISRKLCINNHDAGDHGHGHDDDDGGGGRGHGCDGHGHGHGYDDHVKPLTIVCKGF